MRNNMEKCYSIVDLEASHETIWDLKAAGGDGNFSYGKFCVKKIVYILKRNTLHMQSHTRYVVASPGNWFIAIREFKLHLKFLTNRACFDHLRASLVVLVRFFEHVNKRLPQKLTTNYLGCLVVWMNWRLQTQVRHSYRSQIVFKSLVWMGL